MFFALFKKYSCVIICIETLLLLSFYCLFFLLIVKLKLFVVICLRFRFVEDFTYKKFRYYARFIVVCLLLNFFELVKDLKEECKTLVTFHYNNFYL
jgi:hypothetical protein